MKLVPTVVIFAHLIDVMRDVALLDRNPFSEGNLTDARMNYAVVPNMVRKAAEQLVGGFAKIKDNVESFASTLIEIAEGLGPTVAVEFEDGGTGLGDDATAAHIRAGFRIGKMNDDIVDAPTIRAGLVTPHLFRKLTQGSLQQVWAEPKGFEVFSDVVSH
jgi:hypothetical protein